MYFAMRKVLVSQSKSAYSPIKKGQTQLPFGHQQTLQSFPILSKLESIGTFLWRSYRAPIPIFVVQNTAYCWGLPMLDGKDS
jgi:hypothetical protein